MSPLLTEQDNEQPYRHTKTSLKRIEREGNDRNTERENLRGRDKKQRKYDTVDKNETKNTTTETTKRNGTTAKKESTK